MYGCMDTRAVNYNSSANVYDESGSLNELCVAANYSLLDECSLQPCVSPSNRLCPTYPHPPQSCGNDRRTFLCPSAGPTGNFSCHDPNHAWPGDYICSCAYDNVTHFYDHTASVGCGEQTVYTDLQAQLVVSNYEFSRLLTAQPQLRTRVCDVLNNPLEDCAPAHAGG